MQTRFALAGILLLQFASLSLEGDGIVDTHPEFSWILGLYNAVLLLLYIAIVALNCERIGRTKWRTLAIPVPIVGLLLIVMLFAIPGKMETAKPD